MAFITLILSPGVAALELDAAITVSPKAEVQVTDHPVEKGGDVSDHARNKPEMLTIEGLISNTPITRDQGSRIVTSQGVQFETTALADNPAGVSGYAETAFEILLGMRGKYLTVATERRTYKNMLLTSVEAPQDARTGDVLRFIATFKQIIVSELRTQEVKVAREPKAKKKVETGKQVAKAGTEEDSSALTKIFDAGDWFNQDRGRNVVKLFPGPK